MKERVLVVGRCSRAVLETVEAAVVRELRSDGPHAHTCE